VTEPVESTPIHVPVLLAEVVEFLRPRPGGTYVDATINGGGHAAALAAAAAPGGRVIGFDRDAAMIERLARSRAADVAAGRLLLCHANFRYLDEELAARGIAAVDGVLFDFGLSSQHLDASGRGFSFAADEPLDMRFDTSDPDASSAAQILAHAPLPELTALLRDYGEERFASRIARTIVARRREAPIATTQALREAIATSLPASVRWRVDRHAARVFQALRIAANDELGAVAAALPRAFQVLRPGGTLVAISFHSLEDRLVKHFFGDQRQRGTARPLTRKPAQASPEEIARNPRAASAKLRALEKLG
jgi:16S rRNA (cytosine1402-N4)-methyltransferase